MNKIGIVYFKEKLSEQRIHHDVNDELIINWQKYFKRSKTNAVPYLILDKKTKVPSCWNYDFKIVENDEPDEKNDVLNKVGWIKSQIYDLLGTCLVLDLDAIILKSIDEIFEIKEKIAMAPDLTTNKIKWEWSESWPEAKNKFNAGVLFVNSNLVKTIFVRLWNEKKQFKKITYYDEIIFSAILTELDGKILNKNYNTIWNKNLDLNSVKIIHFCGNRKKELIEFNKNLKLL